MEKLLIVGADGLIGANMALCLSERFEVISVSHHRAARRLARSGGRCIAGHSRLLRHTVDTSRPDRILYCGPAAEGTWAKPDPAAFGDHESQTVQILIEFVQRSGAMLTVLSGDAVFHGPGLWHCEDEPPSSRRGAASLARRIEAAAARSQVLVVRTHAYGWSPAGARPGLAEQLWESAALGRAPELDPDRHASPILVTDLAELLSTAWQRQLTGLRAPALLTAEDAEVRRGKAVQSLSSAYLSDLRGALPSAELPRNPPTRRTPGTFICLPTRHKRHPRLYRVLRECWARTIGVCYWLPGERPA